MACRRASGFRCQGSKADISALVQVDSGVILEDEEVDETTSNMDARKEPLELRRSELKRLTGTDGTAMKKLPETQQGTMSFKVRRLHKQVNYSITAKSRTRRT